MTPQSELVERLRTLLADQASTREVSMSGGRAFMVDDLMVVSAGRAGDLLVRIDAERADELHRLLGASPAEMGAGRSMGPGWVAVSVEAVAGDAQLSSWLEVGMEHHRATAADRT